MRFRSVHALAFILALVPLAASAQTTTTYHLHGEPSNVASHLVLLPANPDAAAQSVLSADLKNQPPGNYLIKEFLTPSGTPGAATTIPSGSVFNFVLHMRKTANFGLAVPRATVRVNGSTGAVLCTATGNSNVGLTVFEHTLSCSTTVRNGHVPVAPGVQPR